MSLQLKKMCFYNVLVIGFVKCKHNKSFDYQCGTRIPIFYLNPSQNVKKKKNVKLIVC